jgi:DNA polymerase-3 subunit delta'
MFESILGNDPIKKYLTKAILENRLPQTLLFSGPDGIGKKLFAKEIAKTLLTKENSTDLHILSPEGKSGFYQIDTLRQMLEKAYSAPFESVGKVFILEDAERMQPAASNALLKTLEEPSCDTTFILLSSSAHEILPTILSRCVTLQFSQLSIKQVEKILKEKNLSEEFALSSSGSIARAISLANNPKIEEQKERIFSLLRTNPSYYDLSKKIDELQDMIELGIDEDPLKEKREVEAIFTYILMWYRDQYARKMKIDSKYLFFPNEPFVDVEQSLESIEKKVEQALFAFDRNMKIATVLKSKWFS